MKRWLCPFIFLSLFLLTIPVRAEDDFGGWSDPGDVDGITCEIGCHVESDTTVSEHEKGSDSSSSVESHHAVTDSEGTKFENNASETLFPDGHREVRDTSTGTTKYGDQTVETSTSVYDKDGNLTDYRHSLDKKRPEAPPSSDEGLQIDSAAQGEGGQTNAGQSTYGGDHIKIRDYNEKVDKILDLRNEQSSVLHYLTYIYYMGSLYFCAEFGNAVLADYGGSPTALYNNLMGPMEQIMNQMPPETAQTMAPARLQIEKGRQEIASMPTSPKDLTYEITDRWGLISGHLAQVVLVKNKGRLYQELWVSSNIRPLGYLNYKTLPQKAKDYISGIAEPSPEIRRLFSRLVLKRTTFMPGRRVDGGTIRTVRRVKLKGDEFQIPAGFKNGGTVDSQAAAQPFKQLMRSRNFPTQ